MPVLSAHGLRQSFGDYDVFTDIGCSVPNDGKIGLVGPNGVGKTTLLLILAGLEQPAAGRVQVARGARIGYLPQEAMTAFAAPRHSVHEAMLSVFAGLRAQEAALRAMEEAMAAGEGDEGLLERYGAAQQAFELAGGYAYETRIRQVLGGLGFVPETLGQPLSQLSGGQKTRVLLARLLLEAPELLVLDEPTNHLDAAAVEWLEGVLAAWEGAVLVVSHDRYFLDRVVDHVWDMGLGGLRVYRGNYSAYVLQRGEQRDLAASAFAQETARLARELDYVRRHIAGQNSDIARGRLKRLSRDLVALETLGPEGARGRRWSETGLGRISVLGVDEAGRRLAALRGPAGPPRPLDLRLAAARRGGDIVLRSRGLAVGYPGCQPLFEAEDLDLARGERVALLGPNGAGKTSLLRTVLGELPPLAGELRLGGGVQPGYFAQAHDKLPATGTVLEALLAAREQPVGEARATLARYLFTGEDVAKPVAVLSGGERSRLALALLALEGANLLVLDEPTNHLDIASQEVLQTVLEGFEGSLLLVSHDRYLVARLATQVWTLAEGRLTVFPGGYEAYLEDRDRANEGRRASSQARAADRQAERQASREAARAARRQAEAVAALEARILELEAEAGRLERALQRASEAGDVAAVGRLDADYAATRQSLAGAWDEWAALVEAAQA